MRTVLTRQISHFLYLINNQMQLLVAVLCADKYFWKPEFGLWIFKIGRSCQKPEENIGVHGGVNIPIMSFGIEVKTDILEEEENPWKRLKYSKGVISSVSPVIAMMSGWSTISTTTG